MPEVQPPTLIGLVNYIKTCPGWDYRELSYQGWDPHQVSYGPRKLFWLPKIPDDSEFFWLNETPEPKSELIEGK